MVKFLPQFDRVVLLSAPADVIVERLGTRIDNIVLGGAMLSSRRGCASMRAAVLLALASAPEQVIGRRKARELEVADLTGFAPWPEGLRAQQLPPPLIFTEGVRC
jgi:hypothetical protein